MSLLFVYIDALVIAFHVYSTSVFFFQFYAELQVQSVCIGISNHWFCIIIWHAIKSFKTMMEVNF